MRQLYKPCCLQTTLLIQLPLLLGQLLPELILLAFEGALHIQNAAADIA